MAQVPGRAITPQVDVGAAPSGRFEAPQFVNYAAQNAIQAGQGLQQMGGALGQVASDMAEKANTARLDDAANQAKNFAMDLRYNKDNGYLNFKGESALKRPNGMSLADEYSDKLKTQLDSISEGLGNTAQRDAFKRFSGNMMTQFRGEAMQHEAQQNNVYMGSVAQATQDTAAREIALSWNDPNGIDGAAQRLKIAAYQEAQITGKSPEWADARAREGLSKGHSLALSAAIERGDYTGANSYLDKYSGQMQADDILRARSAINKQDSQAIVTGAINKAYNQYGAEFSGSDTNRAFNILINAESGGKQFKDYGFGTRPDGTLKGKGFLGELKRPDGTVSTEISVGYEINGKQIDIPLIVPGLNKKELDYLLKTDIKSKDFFKNMPDGLEEKAIAHAKKRLSDGKSVFADQEPLTSAKGAIGIAQVMPTTGPEAAKLAGVKWDENRFKFDAEYNRLLGRAYFDKQVKDFNGEIDKAYAAYNAGAGAVNEAVKKAEKNGGSYLNYLPDETQKYVKNNVSAYASGRGKNIPTQKQMDDAVLSSLGSNATESQQQDALAQSRIRYKQLIASQKEQEFQGVNSAITQLQQNGGDYANLPASVRDAIPFNKIDQVRSYADKLATGTLRTNNAVYEKLSDPTFLAKLSDGEFNALRADLEPKDFQQFSSERASLRSGKALNAAGDIPRESINATLTNKLGILGIYDDVRKDDVRMGVIKQFVSNSVLESQVGLGRKMNDQEVEKHINGLFLRSFEFKKIWGTAKSKPYLSMKYGDIPAGDRDLIELKLKERGLKPSDGDVLGIYLKMKMGNGNG
jgi:Transglycosylase SLT domain